MTDTFTPDWPHGHELVERNGIARRFIVVVRDWPGKYPIIGHIEGGAWVWKFTADGMGEADFGSHCRLRNAPAPKPKPREWWFNVYEFGISAPFTSHDEADSRARPTRLECVHVREVIEPEGGA